ncbi:MAG: T9SS type A sorting domain-containing protein [Bacteroidota bacterium]|nr:T9SS type A sorting domain-containing protein [Bacteroidota bacterium]
MGSGFTTLSNIGQYSGITSNTLSISNVTLSQNNYYYRCIISESGCADTSKVVLLTVKCGLSITTQPTHQTLNVGANAQYTIATSSQTTTYRWQKNKGSGFVNINNGGQYAGVITTTLTIANVTVSQNNYTYRCVIVDGNCSDTSNIVTLKVNCKLAITMQPSSQSIIVGSNAQYIVSALSQTASYQWQENTGASFSNLTNGGQYAGVSNDTLTISNATLSQNSYNYRCIASEAGCIDTSNAALLTVKKNSGVSSIINDNGFDIFPNPSNGNFTIIYASSLQKETLTIYNTLGEQVYNSVWNNETQRTIDLSYLAKGIYFIRLGEDTRRIVKERGIMVPAEAGLMGLR